MQKSKVTIANLSAFGHFVLYFGPYGNRVIVSTGFFDRSKTRVRAMQAGFGSKQYEWSYLKFDTKNITWHGTFNKINLGRDFCTYCLLINGDIGERYVLTSSDIQEQHTAIYDYLMIHYKLPLLKEWIPYIMAECEDSFIKKPLLSYEGENILVPLGDKNLLLSELTLFDFENFNEEILTNIVSSGLASGDICITPKKMDPLEFEGFDGYIEKYGASLVENLEKEINPLLPELKGQVDGLALKSKRLFPQQAACVNGVKELFNHKHRFAILNEGMGVGKVRRCGVRCDCNWNVA